MIRAKTRGCDAFNQARCNDGQNTKLEFLSLSEEFQGKAMIKITQWGAKDVTLHMDDAQLNGALATYKDSDHPNAAALKKGLDALKPAPSTA